MKNQNMSKGLIVQLVLLIILVILMLFSIFYKEILPIADFVAGIIFMIMAYNKRNDYSKFMMVMLILFGVLFMSLGVYNFING